MFGQAVVPVEQVAQVPVAGSDDFDHFFGCFEEVVLLGKGEAESVFDGNLT